MARADDHLALATTPQPGRVSRRVVLALLAGVAATAWWLGWAGRHHAPRGALPEVARTNLVQQAQQWYQPGQTNPFTGWMVDFYQGGSPQSRSFLSNGLLNGLSEGWYTNGQLEVAEQFKDGVSHGLRTKWHPNGAKMTEGMIVNGKHEGVFHRWHDTGTLAEEIEMHDGQPDGPSYDYYPSGFLKTQARLRQGEVVERLSWADGERKP